MSFIKREAIAKHDLMKYLDTFIIRKFVFSTWKLGMALEYCIINNFLNLIVFVHQNRKTQYNTSTKNKQVLWTINYSDHSY